ncbi:FAD synthetase [Sporosarcina sp. P12(2017)]|uniref:FAD synthetase family protein n=1 Tax=unclassified Sporosarcina TaxID=2647733 RepID=UPI000C16ACDA|nr:MULTISPECIES: FAD synthetase family protein [unclassified Sporosarcina]PIC57067.1 FAD synthetase [Sporosarcina sp. P10]PIC60449.1 FAD synthetase [Sporosarcina sp. P12(2017)]
MICFQDNQLELNQSIVTIGAFDGIHRGHQALISQAKAQADRYGVPLVVYTFDPPPKVYFQNQSMLTSLPEKKKFLEELGVSYTVFASFDQVYASRSVQDFIDELSKINPKEIWIGPGFHFGSGKSGSIEDLTKHFNAFQHPVVTCSKGEVISSTRIRELFRQQKAEQAYYLLGRKPYALTNAQ